MTIIAVMLIITIALIHIGDSTHIQLQSITFTNLSTIKRIVNVPINPIPQLELELLLILFN